MKKLSVNTTEFEKIFNGKKTLLKIKGVVKKFDVIEIREKNDSNGNRIIFLSCSQSYTTWCKTQSYITFKLLNSMIVDGKSVQMSIPVNTEIYKDITKDKVINVNMFPPVTCINNISEMIQEIRITQIYLDDKNEISEILYTITKNNNTKEYSIFNL